MMDISVISAAFLGRNASRRCPGTPSHGPELFGDPYFDAEDGFALSHAKARVRCGIAARRSNDERYQPVPEDAMARPAGISCRNHHACLLETRLPYPSPHGPFATFIRFSLHIIAGIAFHGQSKMTNSLGTINRLKRMKRVWQLWMEKVRRLLVERLV